MAYKKEKEGGREGEREREGEGEGGREGGRERERAGFLVLLLLHHIYMGAIFIWNWLLFIPGHGMCRQLLACQMEPNLVMGWANSVVPLLTTHCSLGEERHNQDVELSYFYLHHHLLFTMAHRYGYTIPGTILMQTLVH